MDGDETLKLARCGWITTVANLAEGDARGVIDADMDELPAGTARLALLGTTGDAVADRG